MKVSLKQDTLAYQFGVRPAVACRNMSGFPVGGMIKSMNHFMKGNFEVKELMNPSARVDYSMMGHPEVDALVFYMMNHAVSVIRQRKHPYEELGEFLPLVEEYHNVLAVRTARMFFYLLLICTRESRHCKTAYTNPVWMNMMSTYGNEIKSFHMTIKGSGPDATAQTFRANPPMTDLGRYTAFLSDIFHKGSYSSSFGGKAWGAVADVLRDYVWGKLSAEMMLDTAFTLAHNNGPIFNKGMLFESYSNHIFKILDVQRSGQIPQLVGSKETEHHSNPELVKCWKLCNSVLGDVFSGYVDWFLVEELGALHSYPNEKAAQTQKHGYPTKFKAKIEAEKAKKELIAQKAKEEESKMVEIMPNLKVKKVEIKR